MLRNFKVYIHSCGEWYFIHTFCWFYLWYSSFQLKKKKEILVALNNKYWNSLPKPIYVLNLKIQYALSQVVYRHHLCISRIFYLFVMGIINVFYSHFIGHVFLPTLWLTERLETMVVVSHIVKLGLFLKAFGSECPSRHSKLWRVFCFHSTILHI